jgi:CHRD domain
MARDYWRILIVGAICVMLIHIALAQSPQESTTTTMALADTDNMQVTLSGAREVPKAGDPDGKGVLQLAFDKAKNQICYDLQVEHIDMATGVYIHSGEAGQTGAAKVILGVPGEGTAQGCVKSDPKLMQEILQNPSHYYVNVHNDEYPEGAIRGQLGR